MASIDHHLPAKFMMYSSSSGAYNMGLWIVQNKHRISGVFFNGPAGFQSGEYPDPYKHRLSEFEDVLPTREEVDRFIWRRENRVNDFKEFAKLPQKAVAKIFAKRARDLW